MPNGLGQVLFAGSWNSIEESAFLAFTKTNASAAFIRKQAEYPAVAECWLDRVVGLQWEPGWGKVLAKV